MSRPRPRPFASDGKSNDTPADKAKRRASADRRSRSRDPSPSDGTAANRQGSGSGLIKGDKQSPTDQSPTDPGGSNASMPGASGFGSASSKRSKAAGVAASGASMKGANRASTRAPIKGSQVIPEAVAQRMLRRIAIATGLPSVLGMGVFVGSYLLVSRHILDIPPVATLLASGACFLLGLIGLSYGVLSASWEDAPGTLLGTEQLGVNISRVRASLRAMRQGGASPPSG